jgi:uncharacterized protein
MTEALIIGIASLIGLITQRVLGFGSAPFIVPVLLIYFNPPVAVTAMLLIGTLAFLILLYNSRNQIQISRPIINRMLITGLPGLIIGSYLVTRIDRAPLQIIIGILIIIGALLQEFYFPRPSRKLTATKGVGITGFIGGFLNAVAAMAGPAIVLFLRSHVATPEQIRQNLAVICIFMNMCSVVAIHFFKPTSLASSGIKMFILLLPVILLGNVIGRFVAARINPAQYRNFAFFGIVIAGTASIALGVINL